MARAMPKATCNCVTKCSTASKLPTAASFLPLPTRFSRGLVITPTAMVRQSPLPKVSTSISCHHQLWVPNSLQLATAEPNMAAPESMTSLSTTIKTNWLQNFEDVPEPFQTQNTKYVLLSKHSPEGSAMTSQSVAPPPLKSHNHGHHPLPQRIVANWIQKNCTAETRSKDFSLSGYAGLCITPIIMFPRIQSSTTATVCTPAISKPSTTWNSSPPSIKNSSGLHIHLRPWLCQWNRSGAFTPHRVPPGNQLPLLILKTISKCGPHWLPAACVPPVSNPGIKYTTRMVTAYSPAA